MIDNSQSPPKATLTKLEMANEMYLMAFKIKKTKFSQNEPQLTEVEVHKKTLEYFKNIKKD